jgi:hypothetical protein
MDETADSKICEAVRCTAAALDIRLPDNPSVGEIQVLLNNIEETMASAVDPSELTLLKRFRPLLEAWAELPQQARRARRPQCLLLIHGIRTHAEWQEELANILRTANRVVIPLRYHFFDVFRFLCPCFTRHKPIEKLTREIRDALSLHRDHELAIIAHSFGTFAVSEILKENPDIQPTILVFCGGIVSESFRWDVLKNVPSIVVNECAIRDIWPVMAKSLTWGYGSTGRFGFGVVRVHDRFHDFGHGGFLESAFARKFWWPLLESGKLESGLTKRPGPRYLVSILSIMPLRFVWWLPVAILAVWGAWQVVFRH